MSKTQGHVGSTGGLRGHSIGGTYPWMPVGYGDDTWVPTNLVTGEQEARRYKSVAECLDACVDIWEAEIAGVLPVPAEPVDSFFMPCVPPSMELPSSPPATCEGWLPVDRSPAELDREIAARAPFVV